MAIYDVSFINPKLRQGGQSYGSLIDQLAIKENRLRSDNPKGELAPGDSDLLINDYRKGYTAFTPKDRLDVDVIISRLEKEKKVNALEKAADIEMMNTEIKNENNKNFVRFGNSPNVILKSRMGVLEAKRFRLQENMFNLDQAGSDSSEQAAELYKTNIEWLDIKDALQFSESYVKDQPPTNDFIVNIETNTRGETRSMEITRGKPKPGFLATNGVLDGFVIAGNATLAGLQKDKNVFSLGNKTFSAASSLRPGPGGTFEQDTLIDDSPEFKQEIGTRGTTRAVSKYSYLDPISAGIRAEVYPQSGGWIEYKGAFYHRLDNGQYERYLGATKEQLQIDDNNLMKNMPDELMPGIIRKTVKTNDLTESFSPPVSPNITPAASSTPTVPTGPQGVAPISAPTGTSRTPSPTIRAPQTAPGIAEKVLGVGKGILDYLFRGGK